MSADFGALLKQQAGGHKKPPVLPVGNYQGVIKSYEVGESSKKKTPFVRFHLGLTAWPDVLSDLDKTQEGPNGERVAIDLGKKQQRVEYYLTQDALFLLDDFIRSCGIVPTPGQEYDTIVPNLIGAQVIVDLQQEMGERDTYNKVKGLVGA